MDAVIHFMGFDSFQAADLLVLATLVVLEGLLSATLATDTGQGNQQIALLEEQYKNQTTELMKIQVQEYIDFIKTFVENSNIMTKTFFIVVPYAAPILGKSTNPISRFMPGNKKVAPTANEDFEEYRSQLEQRVGVVEQGLVRCGVRVAELGTEEVVELFYKIFNPGDTEKPMQIT